ncbi:MAG: indole-3-glycerol-phosphate synthase [Holophaga sp.]|nr:indole-3-glycerol-phosphate synthase [Holophaga sp.]
MDFPPSPEALLEHAASLGILRDLLASELERSRGMAASSPPRPGHRAGAGMGPFEAALRQAPLPVIAEFKRGSPSLGPFAAGADIRERLAGYARGGAAACSILAEPAWFLGRPEDFNRAKACGLPLLYKGFVCTEAHLDEAAARGAQAVLLITRILGEHLAGFADAARARGLEPLVEVHGLDELPAAQAAGVRMVGWNARDLADFSVRRAPGALLRAAFPEALLIRESGIRTAEDARAALAEGFDALLIGEALMRAPDPAAFLARIGPGPRP